MYQHVVYDNGDSRLHACILPCRLTCMHVCAHAVLTWASIRRPHCVLPRHPNPHQIAEAMCLQQQQLSRPGTADALGNGEAREGTRRLWRHTSAAVAPSQDGLQPQPRLPGLAGAGAARASHGGGGPA